MAVTSRNRDVQHVWRKVIIVFVVITAIMSLLKFGFACKKLKLESVANEDDQQPQQVGLTIYHRVRIVGVNLQLKFQPHYIV